MRKPKLILPLTAAAVVASLASCASDNEPQPSTVADNQIRFAATADFNRTASKDYTTNNLTEFNVFAYTGAVPDAANPFMDNVVVSKTGTNTWTYSPVQYWPAGSTVDFYAFAPASFIPEGGSPLKSIAYDAYPGTEDVIYAVAPDLSGQSAGPNAQVIFNFRHALAKATVRMSSTNENLTVKVTNVVMANVNTKGSFQFPSASTSGDMTAESVGKWSGQNTPFTYIYHMSQREADRITLTSTPTDMSEVDSPFGGAKFMLPQELSYRSNGAGKDQYIAVMCSIYDAKTGEKLWPNANTPEENIPDGSTFGDGLLKFPLNNTAFSTWQPGYHYIYNLVINSNEEMGAIEFGNPTVDTYVEVMTTYE